MNKMKPSDFNLDRVGSLIKGWRFNRHESTPRTAIFRKSNYYRAIIGANRKIVLCPKLDMLCGKNTRLRRQVVWILKNITDPIERLFALRFVFDSVTLDYNDINLDGYIYVSGADHIRVITDPYLIQGDNLAIRGFVDWGITDVSNDATITDVDLVVVVWIAYGTGDTVKITGFGTTQINATNYPDDNTGNAALHGDIDSKTTLVSGLTDFQSNGSKTIDLGATADSQLEANLASDFWSIGFKGSDETTDSSVFRSSEYTTEADRPQLIVTYTAC